MRRIAELQRVCLTTTTYQEGIAMIEPEVMMPVICPECGRESLCALTVGVAADALLAGKPISLHADCHRREWEADLSEREQLRGYLGATCIRSATSLPEQAGRAAPHVETSRSR
jgi:hypothetical protein